MFAKNSPLARTSVATLLLIWISAAAQALPDPPVPSPLQPAGSGPPSGYEGALDASRLTLSGRDVEHVAAAEEFFGPGRVDDDAGIDHSGNVEGNAARNVGFDEAGEDVD